jgi:hypothetical protein
MYLLQLFSKFTDFKKNYYHFYHPLTLKVTFSPAVRLGYTYE